MNPRIYRRRLLSGSFPGRVFTIHVTSTDFCPLPSHSTTALEYWRGIAFQTAQTDHFLAQYFCEIADRSAQYCQTDIQTPPSRNNLHSNSVDTEYPSFHLIVLAPFGLANHSDIDFSESDALFPQFPITLTRLCILRFSITNARHLTLDSKFFSIALSLPLANSASHIASSQLLFRQAWTCYRTDRISKIALTRSLSI